MQNRSKGFRLLAEAVGKASDRRQSNLERNSIADPTNAQRHTKDL